MTSLPESFIKRLRQRKVIPFVGAGVSMSVRDTKGNSVFPGWRQLLENSVIKLESEKKKRKASVVSRYLNQKNPDYYLAAKHAKEGLGQEWFNFIKSQLNPKRLIIDDDSLRLSKSVWQMGSSLIITTNYDKVLHWTCPDINDLSIWDIQNTAEKGRLLREGLPENPTVWHLHGYIDNPDKIILTPDGYANLYPSDKKVETAFQASLETLRMLLASYTFLFIGFSLTDRFFTEQLAYVNALFDGTTGEHYILVKRDELSQIQSLELPINTITFSDYKFDLLNVVDEMIQVVNSSSASPKTADIPAPPLLATAVRAASTNSEEERRVISFPLHQRGVKWILGALAGLLFFGTLLDSISNALTLITPQITYISTVVLLVLIISLALVQRFKPVIWIDEAGNRNYIKIESYHYLFVGGVIVLLWTPLLINWLNPPDETIKENKNATNVASINNSNQFLNGAVVNTPEIISENRQENVPVNEAPRNNKPRTASTPVPKSSPGGKKQTQREKNQLTADAYSLYKKGYFQEAITECERILKLYPGDKKVLTLKQTIENTKRIRDRYNQ